MKRYTISVNENDYPDIAAWLDAQPNVAASVRQLVEAHLAPLPEPVEGSGGVDLAGIRQVIESALDAKLARLAVAGPQTNHHQPETDVLSAFDDLLE